MRYFIHLSYRGTNYRGWQTQTEKIPTVQIIIEKALSSIFKTAIYVIGCGRTDAEVHASQYFAHFDTETKWDFDLIFRLNKVLPNDISVHDIISVEKRQHARFDARRRSYDYFIHTVKNSFLNHFSTMLYEEDKLDIELMSKAVNLIKQQKDFAAFCITPDAHKSTECLIFNVELYTNQDNTKIRFHIEANHFLRGMIRILVGYLLNIGTKKITMDYFESLFISKQTPKRFDVAPPQGLFLTKVEYPFLKLPMNDIFFGQKEEAWIKRN